MNIFCSSVCTPRPSQPFWEWFFTGIFLTFEEEAKSWRSRHASTALILSFSKIYSQKLNTQQLSSRSKPKEKTFKTFPCRRDFQQTLLLVFKKKNVLSMTMLLLAGPMLTVWGESFKLQSEVSENAVIDTQHSKFPHVRTIQHFPSKKYLYSRKKSIYQNVKIPANKRRARGFLWKNWCKISGEMRSISNWNALKEGKIYCAADLTTTCVSLTHLVSSTLSYSLPPIHSSLHK